MVRRYSEDYPPLSQLLVDTDQHITDYSMPKAPMATPVSESSPQLCEDTSNFASLIATSQNMDGGLAEVPLQYPSCEPLIPEECNANEETESIPNSQLILNQECFSLLDDELFNLPRTTYVEKLLELTERNDDNFCIYHTIS